MMDLRQLAEMLGARLQLVAEGERADELKVRGVSGLRQAAPDLLVFATDQPSLEAALSSPAAAVLVSPALAAERPSPCLKPLLLTAEPKLAFARAARLLRTRGSQAGGVHPTAVVGAEVELGPGVLIEAHAVVGDRCRIGMGTILGAGCTLAAGVVIGREVKIYPRVVLYPGVSIGDRVVIHAGAVLGGDGFGYVKDPATGEYIQFPQQGTLVLEDDVEIGANTTIDRGALDETRIARGTKIDNLVHIGHNVAVGRNVVIAAQTGISGSCSIGDAAVLGGQVGLGDHAAVGEGVILGGQAGVLPFKKLEGPGIAFWGTPAQPLRRYLKQLASLARLAQSGKKNSNAR